MKFVKSGGRGARAYGKRAPHAEQVRTSSRISNPIQNNGQQNTSNTANVIQPAVEIWRRMIGGYVVRQYGQQTPPIIGGGMPVIMTGAGGGGPAKKSGRGGGGA
jgi:hypothetical protein